MSVNPMIGLYDKLKQLDAENAGLHAELRHVKGLNERLCERLMERPLVAPKTTYDQDRFPANPKNGDTFRWFSNDGWYKRICENGLWERHEAPEFEEYRTHFYWLGSAAEVMNREPKTSLEETEMYGPSPAMRKAMMGLKYGEPKLPRGVRTEPYLRGSYHHNKPWMNLGRIVSW